MTIAFIFLSFIYIIVNFNKKDVLMSKNMPEYQIYVGSQKTLGGLGVYSFILNKDAKPSTPILIAELESPSFIALHPSENFLYAISKVTEGKVQNGKVFAYKVNNKLELINNKQSGGAGPCFISLTKDSKSVLVAHYGDGKVSSLPILSDGSVGEANAVIQHEGSVPNSDRQTGPHAHNIRTNSSGNFALSCDLGADKIFIHPIEKETGCLLPSTFEGKASKISAGPRHFDFDAENNHIYVANELDSTVAIYSFDSTKGELTYIDHASSLPPGYSEPNTLSEIVMHPSGKWLYTANRGLDSIAVFAVESKGKKIRLLTQVSCGGKTPRHFHIDPTGKILLSANQNSGNVAIFIIDEATGIPKATGDSVAVPGASCIVFGKIREKN